MIFTHLLTKFDGIESNYEAEIPEKYVKEAEEKNLTLHCRTSESHYGLYTFNDCGHKQYLHFAAVRNLPIKCETCINLKLMGEAEKRGLTLLKKKSGSGLYQFNSCKHFIEIHYLNVRGSQTFCQTCYSEKITTLAKEQGLEFVKRTQGTYSLFKIAKCGHFKEISNRHAFTGAYDCRECLDEKYSNYAKECGLEYIGDCVPPKKDRRLFKLPCGCTVVLAPYAVKMKSWSCRVHDRTAFNQPSAIYLMEIYNTESGQHFLKLGFSKDSNLRIKQYNLPDGFEVSELILIKTDDWQTACDLEKALHKKYKYFRIHKSYISGIMKSGFTECYPIFMKDVLMDELLKLKEDISSENEVVYE